MEELKRYAKARSRSWIVLMIRCHFYLTVLQNEFSNKIKLQKICSQQISFSGIFLRCVEFLRVNTSDTKVKLSRISVWKLGCTLGALIGVVIQNQ